MVTLQSSLLYCSKILADTTPIIGLFAQFARVYLSDSSVFCKEIRVKTSGHVVDCTNFGNVISGDIYNDVAQGDVGANDSFGTVSCCIVTRATVGNPLLLPGLEVKGNLFSQYGRGIVALHSGVSAGFTTHLYGEIRTGGNAVIMADSNPESSMRIYGDITTNNNSESAVGC